MKKKDFSNIAVIRDDRLGDTILTLPIMRKLKDDFPKSRLTMVISAISKDVLKMIDFVEHQEDIIELTKTECSLIQITTSPQGTQTFDLPPTLKRQTGPEKARKDSYSALVLGNWMIKIHYDMMSAKDNTVSTFTPMFIR